MRAGGRGLVSSVLLLLVLLPSGLSAPGEGRLEFEAPGRASGVGNLSVEDDTHLALYGVRPDVRLEMRISGDRLHVTQTSTSEEFVAVGPDNWGAVPGTAKTERTPLPIGAGRLDVARPLDNLTLVLAFEDAARMVAPSVRLDGPVEDVYLSSPGWPIGPKTLEPYPTNVADWPNRQPWMAPGRRHHLFVEAVTLEYVGSFSLLLSGAEVRLTNASDDQTIRTGSWREPAPDDPTGLTAGERYRSRHVALNASMVGSLRLTYAGPYGHVVPPTGKIAGTRLLSVPLANATFDIGDDRFASQNGSFLDVRGLFDVQLTVPREEDVEAFRISAHVMGDMASVAKNRAAPIRFDPQAALWIAGGASSLAMLLALTVWGRDLIALVLGRNTTTALAHPLRVRLLDEIAKRPGITQSQLAARTGVGLWLARYHLRILRRGRTIDVVRNRATDTFFLNGGSFRFYVSPEPATADGASAAPKLLMATALAELHHPVRRRIFETLRRIGPATYAQMAASSEPADAPFPPAPIVSYHAGLLKRAGLVLRRSERRQVVWSLNVDLYRVLVERAERCLTDPSVRRVFTLLKEKSGMTAGQLAAALSGDGPVSMDRAFVGEALARLERTGLVVRDAARDAYAATPGFLTPDP